MYRTLGTPLISQIELTEKCPNRCRHCYNYWRAVDSGKFRNFPVELVDQTLDKLADAKVFHLVMTGGEPLANRAALIRFLDGIKIRGLTCGINSTLSGLTVSDAEYFQEKGVLNVLVSLLGPDEKKHDDITQCKGSFSRTINGINILRKTSIPTSVNMVVSAMNIAEITSTALLVKSLGIKKFFVTRAACPSNCEDFGELRLTKEQFKGYLEEIYSIQEKIGLRTGFLECYPLCGLKELEKFSSFLGRRCLAGVTNVTISPLGEVRPCSHLDFAYGSIFEENMPTIWQRMAEWRENSFLPSVCKSCKIIGICGGGCRMEAKTLNGDICGIDPFAEPENIDYVTEQLNILSRNKALKKMELPKSCMVNPALRVRSESFGGVLFVKDKSSGLVDHQAIAFLSELDKTRRYKTELIVKQAGKYFSNANLNRFVSRLFKEKILIASEGELT